MKLRYTILPVAVLLVAGVASAQQGVTKPQTDSRPTGFRFFNNRLTIKPHVSLSYTYDTNIDADSSEVDDSVFAVKPAVDFEWHGSKWLVVGDIWYRHRYFCQYNDQMGENSFGEALAIWNGGIAIYGAIIAGAITIYCVCRFKKIKVMKAFDMAAPAVMIGQILGRWGNFFNGEAYGTEVLESSPLYFIRMGLAPNIKSYSVMHYFHPTFLYESLWNLIGFIIINALYKKKKFDGQVFLMYITWYGFGRMFIEGLRTDSLYVGVFRISQVVGFVCFVVGSILLIYNLTKARRAAITAGDYDAAYPKITHRTGVATEAAEDIVEENEETTDVSEAYEKRLNDLMSETKKEEE